MFLRDAHPQTGCGVPMCDNNAAVMLRCGHALCEECVQGIVKAKIGEQVVLIKCIGEKNCPEVIPHATVRTRTPLYPPVTPTSHTLCPHTD